jgi:hypothetical protein|nr:MAG TPA: hypothetical protein [Inoviridae sp.]
MNKLDYIIKVEYERYKKRDKELFEVDKNDRKKTELLLALTNESDRFLRYLFILKTEDDIDLCDNKISFWSFYKDFLDDLENKFKCLNN